MSMTEQVTGFRITSIRIVMILAFSAFVTRLLPVAISNYPFNNDSLVECGIASDMLQNGHFGKFADSPWNGTHSAATPLFDALIAFVSGAFGVTPYQCAQVIVSVISVATVCMIFILARTISGGLVGGFAAGFGALTMGTFVFTTGSAWKEALGIMLLVMILVSYVMRSQNRFRILLFLCLMVVPLVHHLVAAIAMLFMAYMLAWRLYFAFRWTNIRRGLLLDAVTAVVPILWMSLYYYEVALDRISLVSSPIGLIGLLASFFGLCVVLIGVLSIKKHSKRTYSPLIGIGVVILLVLDFLGFLFPYSPSASEWYLLFIASVGVFLTIGWYGTEIIVETRRKYNAVQIGLALPALTIIGFGLQKGFLLSSHQIAYRTFDFLDIFILIGIAGGFVFLQKNHSKAYPVLGLIMVLSLLVTFPFAYASGSLLGVRHDTQAYEVDALTWVDDHLVTQKVISDERIGYISWVLFGVAKDAGLPVYMKTNFTISADWVCVAEDSWTDRGVNCYPVGRIVVQKENFTRILSAANVLYVGGPVDDRVETFRGSVIGASVVYSPPA